MVASPSSLSSSSCCLFLFLGGGGPVSFRVCVLLLRGMEASQLPGVGMIMKGMGSESASGGAMEKGLMSSSFEGGHRGWAQRGRM